jgi:Tol biopolymer transport system component
VHRQGYIFVAPLESIDDVDPDAAVEAPPGRRWLSNPLMLVVLAAIIVGGVFVLRELIRPDDGDVGASRPNFAEWKLRSLGPHPFAASAIKPAFAKSDNLLAVVAPDPESGVHSLFLIRPDGGEPLQMTRDMEVRGPSPEFTADDSHIIFTTYHSDPELGMVPNVWQVPVPAGEPTLLVRSASAASTSPDGRKLVYAAVTPGGTAIRVRHQDGSELEVAARGFWPRWSPDGRWIAFTTSDPEGGQGTIHVVRPDGSEHRELTTTSCQVYGLYWTPDSARVIYAAEQSGPMMLWSVDVESGIQQSITRSPGICAAPTMAPDGNRLVFDFSRRWWYVYLAARAGDEAQRVLAERGMQAAALAPDGTRIAIALGAAAQSPAVSLLDLDTMERHTVSGMAASAVAWMPGGSELLIAAHAPDGISNWIWRLPTAGGLPQPVLKGEVYWNWPSPSPDGALIAAVRRSASGDELVLHHLEQDRDRVLAAKPIIETPRWSPDGRFLAWSGGTRPDDVGSGGVWVCPAEGGVPRRLTVDGAWPVWEGDGEHILFARYLENEGLWRVPLTGGTPHLVRRFGGEMQELYVEGLDIGQSGTPLLLFFYRFTSELFVLESPDS